MSDKFVPGDLIILNDYGMLIGEDYEDAIGIVITRPYNIMPQIDEEEGYSFYIVYDVLLGAELIKTIPQEFMEHYKKYEKDSK